MITAKKIADLPFEEVYQFAAEQVKN